MKIFGYHDGAAAYGGDWNAVDQYDDTTITDISDPAGDNAANEITSIPSPFARMELTRTAFARIVSGGLKGNTIHHKLVAQCFDIGEIFFNYDKFHGLGQVNLLKWDKSQANALAASSNPAHALLGRTLQLYLNQDGDDFNFAPLQSIYLLTYSGPGMMKPNMVIGATSPVSFFFTPGNDLSAIGPHLPVGGHTLFQKDANGQFTPLLERDKDYVLYWYKLQKAFPDFANRFKEINAYLDETFKLLPHDLQLAVNGLTAADYSALQPLELAAGVPVEVLGTNLRQTAGPDLASSGFLINSDRPAKKPLVLPVGLFTMPWQYVNAPWNSATRIPTRDPRALDERTLPNDGTKYPYLTMDDLLENEIIEINSPLSEKDFFGGNYTGETHPQHAYLLPVKPLYFDYFSVENLKQAIRIEYKPDGNYAHHVKVTLKVPVAAGTVTYERTYYNLAEGNEPASPQDGRIVAKDFSAVLFPIMRFPAGVQADYRAALLTKITGLKASIDFYDADGKLLTPTLTTKLNNDAAGNLLSTEEGETPIYALNDNFDFMAFVFNDGTRGLAIPSWRGNQGANTFKFAVDFGTTNTHIEYETDGGPIKPLDDKAGQFGMLTEEITKNVSLNLNVRNNFIPLHAEDGEDTLFPMRTMLGYKKGTAWKTKTSPYVTGSLAFYYDKGINPLPYKSLVSNLKWSTDTDIEAMINVYLGSLLLFMRNKVLMEGGNLTSTKVTWFYPTSMPPFMVGMLAKTWSNLYAQYFGGPATNVVSIPEAVAPYLYYASGFAAVGDVLTIDIGGGTSDAVIIDKGGSPACITSFRFAANALFGDGFITKGGIKHNSFVKHFKDKITHVLKDNKLTSVSKRIEEVGNETQSSNDLTSFFFTLVKNTDVIKQKCGDNVDFMKMLAASPGAKTLFLLFYTAIIYHLAHLIKAKGKHDPAIREPQYIAFSGNGSKLLQMLNVGTDMGKKALERYTQAIFEKVTGQPYLHKKGVELIIDLDKPKEATCKGGLEAADGMKVPGVECLLGTADDRFVTGETYSLILDDNAPDTDVKDGMQKAMNNFADTFFALMHEQKPEELFGTWDEDTLKPFRSLFTDDPMNCIPAAQKFYGLESKDAIKSSLFFIPVTNLIYELAKEIPFD